MANIITSNYTYYSNPTQVKSSEFWYDDGKSSTITMDSFLSLMIAELANQDFNNATDTSGVFKSPQPLYKGVFLEIFFAQFVIIRFGYFLWLLISVSIKSDL